MPQACWWFIYILILQEDEFYFPGTSANGRGAWGMILVSSYHGGLTWPPRICIISAWFASNSKHVFHEEFWMSGSVPLPHKWLTFEQNRGIVALVWPFSVFPSETTWNLSFSSPVRDLSVSNKVYCLCRRISFPICIISIYRRQDLSTSRPLLRSKLF